MQQLSVELVPLLRDNYVFVLHRQGLAAVVDPDGFLSARITLVQVGTIGTVAPVTRSRSAAFR